MCTSASIDRITHCWSRPTIQQFTYEDKSYSYPFDYIAALSNASLQKLAGLLVNFGDSRWAPRIFRVALFDSHYSFPTIQQIEQMTDIPTDDIMAIFAIEIRRHKDGEWFCINESPGLELPNGF